MFVRASRPALRFPVRTSSNTIGGSHVRGLATKDYAHFLQDNHLHFASVPQDNVQKGHQRVAEAHLHITRSHVLALAHLLDPAASIHKHMHALPAVKIRPVRPTIRFYRYLYDSVSQNGVYPWTERRLHTNKELQTLLANPRYHFDVLYVGDLPAGFCESIDTASTDCSLAEYSEFSRVMKNIDIPDRNACARSFKFIDKDQSNLVDVSELHRVMKKLNPRITEDDVNVIMRYADSNGDGEIDFEEFCTVMQKPCEPMLGSATKLKAEDQAFNILELKYFGLMPEYFGLGLGRYFLDSVLSRAFNLSDYKDYDSSFFSDEDDWVSRDSPVFDAGADVVWLHTCSADHPMALRTYLNAGFHVGHIGYVDELLPTSQPDWPVCDFPAFDNW